MTHYHWQKCGAGPNEFLPNESIIKMQNGSRRPPTPGGNVEESDEDEIYDWDYESPKRTMKKPTPKSNHIRPNDQYHFAPIQDHQPNPSFQISNDNRSQRIAQNELGENRYHRTVQQDLFSGGILNAIPFVKGRLLKAHSDSLSSTEMGAGPGRTNFAERVHHKGCVADSSSIGHNLPFIGPTLLNGGNKSSFPLSQGP
ncbi:hypothetical protein Ddc_11704 [Ditylenchus destructor]|nr:hypothetical protein Ddc_11704 [Ditylenchus destructor]